MRPNAVPLAMLDPASFPAVPDDPGDIAPGFADGRVRKVLGRLAGVFSNATCPARIGVATLKAAGLTEQDCRAAAVFVYRSKAKIPTGIASAVPRALAGMLGGVAANNNRVLRTQKALDIVADVLAGRLGSAALTVHDGAADREVYLCWRDDISSDWLKARHGIIHADATMTPDIVRVWLPDLKVLPSPPVAAPHMHVKQIGDRVLGYTAVIPGKQGKFGRDAAAANTRRIVQSIKTLSVRYDGKGAPGGPDGLLIVPKALEAVLQGKLPANVKMLHFGKLRGQDAFKGVAFLLIVSRPLPPPHVVEDRAELMFGDVARLPWGEFYPKRPGTRQMADGTRRTVGAVDYHPAARVDTLRRAFSEDEITQAVGRVRGVHRTAANPVDVFILTNLPAPDVPVSEVVTLDDIWRDLAGADPVRELWDAGVLPMDWPGLAAVLAGRGFRTGAADKADACRGWFRDNPRDGKRLAGIRATAAGSGTANVGEISDETILGEISDIRASEPGQSSGGTATANPTPAAPVWQTFRYRRAGQRKSGRVLVASKHTDPRAAVESLMGPLDVFAPRGNPPFAKRPGRPASAPVPELAP